MKRACISVCVLNACGAYAHLSQNVAKIQLDVPKFQPEVYSNEPAAHDTDRLPSTRVGVKNAALSGQHYERYVKKEASDIGTISPLTLRDTALSAYSHSRFLVPLVMVLGLMTFSVALFILLAVACFGMPKSNSTRYERRRTAMNRAKCAAAKSTLSCLIVDMDEVPAGTVCAVCLEEEPERPALTDAETSSVANDAHDQWCKIPCNHCFHRHCLDRWLTTASSCQQRCPLCNWS